MSLVAPCSKCFHGIAMMLASAILWVAPLQTWAQTVDPQRATDAQALFEQAVREMDEGQTVSACKKLEEVTRVLPEGIGGKYALGECYERLGRLASAWAQFSFAYQMAERLGQTERASDARARADALQPKLATLKINLPNELRSIPGISVVRDGMPLGEGAWGTATYVDTGAREVVVTAPGYSTWKKRAEVLADGVHVTVDVPIRAIDLLPKETPTNASAAESKPSTIVVVTRESGPTWMRPLGITTTVLGGATIIAGGVFGGLAIARKNESNANGRCDVSTNKCDETGVAMRREAVELGNASTALFVAGMVVGAGGIALWGLAPKEKPASEKKTPAHSVEVRASVGWLELGGYF